MNKSTSIIFYLSCFTVLLLCGYDIYLLSIYATDVPFWDMWDLLPQASWTHLFDFYNQNMQFFYFIISEILYRLVDWNLRYFTFISFAIYLFLTVLYGKILSSTANIRQIYYYPLFLVIILTPMLGYNWLWVLLIQTHTFILFFLLAIYFGFVKDDKKYSVYLCSICLFLSMISMNIPLAVGGVIAYIIKEIINAYPQNINKALKKCAIFIAMVGILIGTLSCVTNIGKFVDFRPHENVMNINFIENFSFYLINSMSVFAFAHILNWKICVGILIIHGIILTLVFKEQYKCRQTQALWGIIFSVLLMIAGVVSYRQGEVYFWDLSFIRHNETTFILVPATLAVLALSKYKLARYYSIILLLGTLYGVITDISAKRFQFFGSLFYKNGCVCLNHYYYLKTIEEWQCKMNCPVARPDAMKKATEMNLSFIKTIQTCNTD